MMSVRMYVCVSVRPSVCNNNFSTIIPNIESNIRYKSRVFFIYIKCLLKVRRILCLALNVTLCASIVISCEKTSTF